jgi:energy-coupling factor transporter ATP-binding protein EcfA2
VTTQVEIESLGNEFIATAPYVRLRFTKLRAVPDGYSAYVYTTGEGLPGHGDGLIYEGHLLLHGTRSRADYVRECTKRIADIDWQAILTKSCSLVMQAMERGTPMVDLATIPQVAPPPYILYPLIQEGGATILFGPGGSGKSLLAQFLAVILSEGAERLGFQPLQPQRIAILDYEDEASNLAYRLHLLSQTLGLWDTPSIYYKRADVALPALADQLRQELVERQIDGLIIDSAAQACGDEPEKAAAANGYFRALRSLHLSWSLTIAHQPHNLVGEQRPFGSVYWWNNARSIWQVTKHQDDGDGTLHLGLWHRKANNDKRARPLGMAFEFTEDGLVIRREDVQSIPEFTTHLPFQRRIEAFMKTTKRPVSVEDIAEEFGQKPNYVRSYLSRFKGRLFVLLPDGKWGLLTKEES